jgi:hypothetical protein
MFAELGKREAMSEDGSNKVVPAIVLGIMGLILVIALVLAGGKSSATHRARKEFGKIYRANDGRYYTRGHDRGGFSDWEYVDAGGGDSSGSFSGGSWSRVSSTPSGMTATSKVVEEEGGKPTNEVEEESAEPGNEEITEATTESEADSMDSSSDSSSDSSADSGDSGSGDGGDGGGGSD